MSWAWSSASDVKSAFTPEFTTIVFSAFASTVMSAVPVSPAVMRVASVTPAPRRLLRSSAPASSSPSSATNVVAAPARAAATAWLAPLPPGCRAPPVASTVSPGAGMASTV
jgi:hypothetical protein